LARKVFSMPPPFAEGKAFYTPPVIGIVVSGITAVRVAAAVIDAPDLKGIAMANRADNRIVAPEVASPRPASHPIQYERDCHDYLGGIAPR
jgi:hypothetical protein